jgi:hypothetical protein
VLLTAMSHDCVFVPGKTVCSGLEQQRREPLDRIGAIAGVAKDLTSLNTASSDVLKQAGDLCAGVTRHV